MAQMEHMRKQLENAKKAVFVFFCWQNVGSEDSVMVLSWGGSGLFSFFCCTFMEAICLHHICMYIYIYTHVT